MNGRYLFFILNHFKTNGPSVRPPRESVIGFHWGYLYLLNLGFWHGMLLQKPRSFWAFPVLCIRYRYSSNAFLLNDPRSSLLWAIPGFCWQKTEINDKRAGELLRHKSLDLWKTFCVRSNLRHFPILNEIGRQDKKANQGSSICLCQHPAGDFSLDCYYSWGNNDKCRVWKFDWV